MASSLRRLVDSDSFGILQEKLDKWLEDYRTNTSSQNISQGCEIFELNARIQEQVFRLLNLFAAEAGTYSSMSFLKSRLGPLMGPAGYYPGDACCLAAEVVSKERELDDLRRMYEESMGDLEDDLKEKSEEMDDLKKELEETRLELERQNESATSEKSQNEAEITNLKTQIEELQQSMSEHQEMASAESEEKELAIKSLRNQLTFTELENSRLQECRSQMADDYAIQLRTMQDQLSAVDRERRFLLSSPPPHLPLHYMDTLPYHHHHHTHIPKAIDCHYDPCCPLPDTAAERSRQTALISRYNDMFATTRLNAMDTLDRFSADKDNNRKIVFAVLVEAFNAAKPAVRQHKSKLRSQIVSPCLVPLAEETQLRFNAHPEPSVDQLADLSKMVVRALRSNPHLHEPAGVGASEGFRVVNSFIKEACKLAWEMTGLARPMELAIGVEGEIIDQLQYRRSYDSEYSVSRVHHYVWPCLLQDGRVMVKGEAVTKTEKNTTKPILGKEKDLEMKSASDSTSLSRYLKKSQMSSGDEEI